MARRLKQNLCQIVGILLMCVAPPVHATTSDTISDICDSAALHASRATGVPLNVLRAISLTETGRARGGVARPWPWTVNMEGVGKWFDTHADALVYVQRHKARGAVSFDVGCFQINYKWHGKAFPSVDAMFDPNANALYAARFLQRLYAEFGDWSVAAGAYHSRTPKYATRYRKRFARFMTSLGPMPSQVIAQTSEPRLAEPRTGHAPERQNLYPLLVSGSSNRATASLVPLRQSPSRRLIDISGQ